VSTMVAAPENLTHDKGATQNGRAHEWTPELRDPAAQRQVVALIRESGGDPGRFLIASANWLEGVWDRRGECATATLQAAFLLSLIHDQIAWGASLTFRSTQLRIVVPQLSRPNASGDRTNRSRLSELREKPVSYRPTIGSSDALRLLNEGSLSLERVDSNSDIYGKVFAEGITTWSMPYRGREGRSGRFVVVVENRGSRYPLGLIEIGDDAPLSPVRDRELGFVVPERTDLRVNLAQRLSSFRQHLWTDGLNWNPHAPVDELVPHLDAIRQEGSGRQGSRAEIGVRKRYSYLYRLAAGEAALLGRYRAESAQEGVRALRDILLTRVHGEITVCGALPPFGSPLGGKLVASLIAHPLIRSVLDRPPGEILRQSFDTEAMINLLPTGGPILLTTKGLYAGHSAQYNRVKAPRADGGFEPLRKVGVTSGETTSHISNRTMQFALALNGPEGRLGISREYGSGGGKRHRLLQKAAASVGISPGMTFARVHRPVYALRIAANIQDVIANGATPDLLFSDADAQEIDPYLIRAHQYWRDNFASIAYRRVERGKSGAL